MEGLDGGLPRCFPPTHLVILKGHCGLSKARLIRCNVAEEALLYRHAVSLVLYAFAQQSAHDGAGLEDELNWGWA